MELVSAQSHQPTDSLSMLLSNLTISHTRTKCYKSRDLAVPSQNLKNMLGSVGNLQKAELMDDGDDSKWKRGIVTYDLKEDAQNAIERFHETPFEVSGRGYLCEIDTV